MRRMFIIAGLALAVAVPATADAASCSSRKTTGTVVGAVGGGLLGGALTHGSAGPLIGAVGGGLVGHQVGKNGCRKATYSRSYRRAEPARYASSGPSCRYETRTYYDERGRAVQSPVKVCR